MDHFSDISDFGHVFIPEHFQVFVDGSLSITHGLLKFGGVNTEEVIFQPAFLADFPVVNGGPKLIEGGELLDHLLDVIVVGLFVVRELLVLVVLLGLVAGSRQFVMQSTGLDCNLDVVVKVKVLVKGRHFVLDFSDLGIKLILVLLHDVDELVFLFVEIVALLLDLLVSVTWGAEQAPLSVKVFLLSKLVLELVEDAIHFHS